MTIEQGTIKRAPPAGRELPPRASDVVLVRHHNPRTRFLAAELWDNGFALPRSHLERQTMFTFTAPTSVFPSVIEPGINLSRPAGDRVGW